MNREYISDALGSIDDRHIDQSRRPPRGKRLPAILKAAVAAALVLAVLGGAVALFASPRGLGVKVYAHAGGQMLTSAGVGLTTGSVDGRGILTGHPLLFYLDGERIESVRFSCKNSYLRFTDMTETRDGYGLAQNFTVEYGEDESQYPFLIVDWVPQELLRCLREDCDSLDQVPEEYREDVIVLEVKGLDGGEAVKAVTVRLLEDGTFFTSFDDYKITGADDFVRRPDAEPLSKADVYFGTDSLKVEFLTAGGEPKEDVAGWYSVGEDTQIRVTWTGEEPHLIQMFYTDAGSEMMEYTRLLETRLAENADGTVYFSGASFPEYTMGHVWFVAVYDGSETATSSVYEVTSDILEE